jgi:large subunit ribosomal protein L3
MSAIVGKKLGMTRVFTEDGTAVPVTVIEAEPNTITAIRKTDRDGYDAVQLAGIPAKEAKLTKAELGHLKKASAPPSRTVVEFRDATFPAGGGADAPAGKAEDASSGTQASGDDGGAAEDAPSDEGNGDAKVGDTVTVSTFEPGQKVKISAISIGKGFQGTIKRHNFSRGPVTHGSHNVRAPGSAGASADPARIFPGQKMPGRMGATRVTQLGATIHDVDAERNLLLVKGSVPGGRNATVEVRSDG